MKYLRLINGATLPYYDLVYTNAWIIKIKEAEASLSEIREFFGKDTIPELDLLDDKKQFIASKAIEAKYTNLYYDTEKEVHREYRIIKAAETIPVLDENGIPLFNKITNEPLTTLIPEETELVERVEEIPMVYVVLEKPKLEEEINMLKVKAGYVNPNTLNLAEYKSYYREALGRQCSETIYKGCDISLAEAEETAHFSFTEADQRNIKNLFDTARDTSFQVPLPYHADGGICQIYAPADILTLYAVMQTFITYHTTYCNILNRKVDAADSLSEIKAVTYGMALDTAEQKQLDTMVEQIKTAVSLLIETYLTPPEGDNDTNADTSSEKDTQTP